MAFTITDSDVSAVPATQSVWYQTDIDILAAGIGGAGVISGCDVTAQGSPDMTVAIAAGTIKIASGAQVAVTSGNGTITTAHATLPRIDLVSASNAGVKTVTAGTAAAAPKPPALPAGHVALAYVDVPAADTTIGTAQITDKRVVQPASTHSYIGYNTIGASTESPTNPKQYFKQIVLASAGTITSIGGYFGATSYNTQGFGVAVYADNSGAPGQLMAHNWPYLALAGVVGNIALGTSGSQPSRWMHIPIGLWVPAGTYWISIYSAGNNGGWRISYDTGTDQTSVPAGNYWTDGGATTLTTTARKFSIRADFLA